PEYIKLDNHNGLSFQIYINNNFIESYSYYHDYGLFMFSRTFLDELNDYIKYEYNYNETTGNMTEKHYRNGLQFYKTSEPMDEETFYRTYSNQSIYHIDIDFNYLDKMVVERPTLHFNNFLRDVNMTFKHHPVIHLETMISNYEITLTE